MATQQRTARTQTTEREQQPVPPPSRQSLIEEILNETEAQRVITQFLPRGETMGRITAAVELECRKNPTLAKCTPASLVDAVARALRMGLEIGEDVYIVPHFASRKNVYEATAIADYKGLAKLMVGCGALRSLQAFCVFEGEHFRYEQGANPILEHHPFLDYDESRPLVGAYARFRRPFGYTDFEYMPIGEIEKIRATSKSWGPKTTKVCPPWYAAKTVIRRIAKLIPKDPKYAKFFLALEEDTAAEFDEREQLAAIDAVAAGAADRPEPERVGGVVPIASDDRPTEGLYGDGTRIEAAGERMATEAQIEQLLDLADQAKVPPETHEKIERFLKKGLTYHTAATWITTLETKLAESAAQQPAASAPASAAAAKPEELFPNYNDPKGGHRDALREG